MLQLLLSDHVEQLAAWAVGTPAATLSLLLRLQRCCDAQPITAEQPASLETPGLPRDEL